MGRNMNITFSSGISNLVEYNSSFDVGVLRVAYTGKNRNNSFISKNTFERCMQSIYNCPVVCRYDREADEIGSHDMEVVANKDGDLKLVYLTQPVGVVPESAKTWWLEYEEDDGAIHEYLCTDVLLWKRQEAYQKIKDDGITDESMEISVKDGQMEDGVFVINDFEFTAFCLLGTAEPCYESAALTVFSKDDFRASFEEMLHELKETTKMMQLSDGICIDEKILKGGTPQLDKHELMSQYSLTEDMIDFNLDDFSVEELVEKFEAIKAIQGAGSGEPESAPTPEAFALAEQFREELVNALCTETIETCFGEMPRYWYLDYDAEAGMVYCHDSEDWKLYGFPYSMNGDNVVIDFEGRKRMKFAIVEFDEGEQPAPFANIFSRAEEAFKENDSTWSEKYSSISDEMDEVKAEVEELRQFKTGVETQQRNEAINSLFAKFEAQLGENEDYRELKESHDEFSIEEIEEKCYAMIGRAQAFNFSLERQNPQGAPKLVVERKDSKTEEPYGGVFAKYGIH